MLGVARRLRQCPLPLRLDLLPPDARRIVESRGWSTQYVQLIWSAAGNALSDPTVEWLSGAAITLATVFVFQQGARRGSEAVLAGWAALRTAFRTMGIAAPADLQTWLQREGLPSARPGAYL
eukprot:12364716-Karenia_brevis.AAC.1